MDPSKVEAILNWPSPKSVGDVRSFHGLVTFYKKIIKGFSGIVAPILDIIKGGVKCKFKRTKIEEKSF